MGPSEIIKREIEREEKGRILLEFQRSALASDLVSSRPLLLDRVRRNLEIAASVIFGLFLGNFALFLLYVIVKIIK